MLDMRLIKTENLYAIKLNSVTFKQKLGEKNIKR